MEETENDVIVEENSGDRPQKKAKYEQLARSSAQGGFNREDSFPLVEAHGLTGDTLLLEGCHTVGHVMAKLAIMRNIFADRVVVMDNKDGRKMNAIDSLTPMVQFVILNEEDIAVDIASTCMNIQLHAQQGDHIACSRLLETLKLLGQQNGPQIDESITSKSDSSIAPASDDLLTVRPDAESILCYVVTHHDTEWETSVKTLMQVGATGIQAFLRAASTGCAESVAFLLSVQPALIRAKTEDIDIYGETALTQATLNGQNDMVAQLLAAGANVDHANSDGYTALIIAATKGYSDVVAKLLAAKAKVEHANSKGNTALIFAAVRGYPDVVAKLLAAKANVAHANSAGNTPLILATSSINFRSINGRRDRVAKLLAAGSKIEHANSDGNTALTFAALAGCHDAVGELVAAGAKVEHANSDGDTALTIAARKGNSWIVGELLAAGAKVDHRNSAGDTALTLATSRDHTRVVSQLVDTGRATAM